jgi:hypothetical protein
MTQSAYNASQTTSWKMASAPNATSPTVHYANTEFVFNANQNIFYKMISVSLVPKIALDVRHHLHVKSAKTNLF